MSTPDKRRSYNIVRDIEIILAEHQIRIDALESLMEKQTKALESLNTRVTIMGVFLVLSTGLGPTLAPMLLGG